MNISEISVTENCEERLRPLFLIKLSSTQKEKNLDQIAIDDFIQSLLKGFDSKYHTEFYTILKYLINTENIKEKQDLLNRLKKLTYDDLLTISKLNLFNRQLLSKFIKLETKELNSETNNLISYLQTQNFDYNNFLELKHKEITILDDNVYNTITTTDFNYYEKVNSKGIVELLLYIYKNGLVLLFEKKSENYIYSFNFFDSTSALLIKEFLKFQPLDKNTIIVNLIKFEKKITPETFIKAAKTLPPTKEKDLCYSFADQFGVSNPEYIYYLADFFKSDYTHSNLSKAIELYRKAIEGGITKSYEKLADIYNFKKDYASALTNLEKAKVYGYDVDKKIQDTKNLLIKYSQKDVRIKSLINIINEYKMKTQKDCYKLIINENDTPTILNSKIGGSPYLPLGENMPKDKNGDFMPLLIQINFAELNSDIYPKEGILEVFLDKDFSWPAQYEIRYYKNVSNNYETNFPNIDLSNFVIRNSLKITFEKSVSYMPTSDFRFSNTIAEYIEKIISDETLQNQIKEIAKIDYNYYLPDYKNKEKDLYIDLLSNVIYDECQTTPITLGGYADFTQQDPRTGSSSLANLTECLIKIDSEGYDKLQIGDAGIISIFISKEDLESANFQKAVLDWDCL